MKRDIRKAVEEIKSAGMEDFLHQDPSTFDCDDDCTTKIECSDDCNCPRTRCTRVKHCTFVTNIVRSLQNVRMLKNGHLLRNVLVFAFKNGRSLRK
ncbi:hypothetical protein TuanDB_39000 [Bacillus anthracis]|uniref:Uncharacterized protein n=1 Tax=Bacillus anthracis TaxID=1392 RepID=A0A640LIQ0_BACAN|nr:hypothetical protein TuanDB_39000 [Bacillus anthracis]